MIKKVKGGFVVVHTHHAPIGGRVNATPHPVSYAKALSIHRAIEASQHKSDNRFYNMMTFKKRGK